MTHHLDIIKPFVNFHEYGPYCYGPDILFQHGHMDRGTKVWPRHSSKTELERVVFIVRDTLFL